MKRLLIPDIHTNITRVQEILNNNKDADVVTWLGDWLDNWDDSIEENVVAAHFLKLRMHEHPEDDFLLGNHDTQYLFASIPGVRCSGFTKEKLAAVAPILADTHDKWDLAVKREGWLISHAGLHPFHGVKPKDAPRAGKEALDLLHTTGEISDLLQAGWVRGGSARRGGLNWLDFDQEFQAIDKCKQVVGHTRGKKVRQKDGNWCIDTGLQHYAILQDGELFIKQ